MRYPLVRSLVAHFLERAGLEGSFHLTLSADRFERARKRRGYDTPTDEHKDYGAVLYGKPPVFWVNVPKHRSIAQLADTCAHEVAHVHLQDGGHPQGFDQLVRRLLRGGRL